MQQKVSIAVAIVHEPKLVLLDEPTLGIDVQATEEIKQIVRNMVRGRHAVLLTTHQLDLAEELSDRVAIVKEGRVLTEDTVDNIIRKFDGDSYMIDYHGVMPETVLSSIVEFGGVVDDERVFVRGDAAHLYRVLELMRPIPLIRVERDNSGLTDVCSTLIQSGPKMECCNG